MTVKLVSDAQALQSMRASDFDACSAYGEVIDNALQANAQNVRISFSHEAGRGKAQPLNYIAFGDDGDGMDAHTLQRCLQLGYSSRFNDRSGIGRFGVGVTLGAINQCKRVDVFSKTKSGAWLFTQIDLDDIASGNQEGIPEPQPESPPNELVDLAGSESGTLMIWRKHDKQDAPASRLKEDLIAWAGRVYRKFIWRGANITVNGERVHAIDPLYVTTRETQFPDDPPAEEYQLMTIDWPVPSQLDAFAGDIPPTSRIYIRISLLPEALRQKQGAGLLKSNVARHIDENEGMSIMRNDREVFYGKIPNWPGAKLEEIDRWWGCEISFDAVLDYSFHVKNIKRGAVPLRQLKVALSDKIEPTRNTSIERVREVWLSSKKEQESKDKKRPHARAERIAGVQNSKLPKGVIDAGLDSAAALEQFTEDFLKGKSAEEQARLRELFKSQPYTISDDGWRGAEFLEIKHLGGKDVLLYNSKHLFHQVLSEIENLIDDGDEQAPSLQLRALVDLLLISFSKAESMMPAEQLGQLEQLRNYWGNFLKQYITAWKQEVSG
jgi:histidine kinase/DNA gyrase B/HSP90-like ATPase